MKIIVKYKSDDTETNFTRFGVLFGGRPVVISWDASKKSVNKDTIMLICSGLHYKGIDVDPRTANPGSMAFAGGLWFNKDRHPYGSKVEILSFVFQDNNGKEYPVKVKGGIMGCGMQ